MNDSFNSAYMYPTAIILIINLPPLWTREAANAAIHPPGNNHIVRQVLDERQAISGRVQSLVRPPHVMARPLGMFFLPVSCHHVQAVSNARINPAGSIVSSLQSWRMKDKLMPLGLNESLDRLLATA
jgi:hypothetical protein